MCESVCISRHGNWTRRSSWHLGAFPRGPPSPSWQEQKSPCGPNGRTRQQRGPTRMTNGGVSSVRCNFAEAAGKVSKLRSASVMFSTAHRNVYVFGGEKNKSDPDYDDTQQLNPVFHPGPVRCVGLTSGGLKSLKPNLSCWSLSSCLVDDGERHLLPVGKGRL